ncbi:hypothetical protein ACXC9Q_24150 [Kribbella sp. CWNU-51]
MRSPPLIPPRIDSEREGFSMWYVFIFSGLAILCVVVVLIRNARTKAGEETASPSGTDHHHTDTEQDRARRERKRRRAQSKADRRKRH